MKVQTSNSTSGPRPVTASVALAESVKVSASSGFNRSAQKQHAVNYWLIAGGIGVVFLLLGLVFAILAAM